MDKKPIQLSPNSLNLFLECPHCFWLDKNLGIKRPPPYPYALNSAVDGLLKEEFDTYRAKKLDYKSTGSSAVNVYDRFQLQLDTYTFLMEKNGFLTPRKGYLAFYIVDKSRGFIDRLPFRKEMVEIETNPSDIYEIFKDAVACLKSATPPPHSSDCKFSQWLKTAKNYYT